MGSSKKELGQIGDVKFLFNPPEDTDTEEPEYVTRGVMSAETPPKDYVGGKGEEYDIKLFFDDSYAGETGHTSDNLYVLKSYTKKDSKTGAPPIVLLQFGETVEWVRVERRTIVSKRRNAFNAIIRADVQIHLTRVADNISRTPREEKGEQFYYTQSNDSFRKIAYIVLGDADLGIEIQKANPSWFAIMDGMILPAGVKLKIPDWSNIEQAEKTSQVGLVNFNA